MLYLTVSMDPRTGAGMFSGKLIEGVRKQYPGVQISVLTGDDLLRPPRVRMLRNLPAIRTEIKRSDIVHALDAYPYGVLAALANIGIGKPLVITAVGTGSVQKLRSPLLRWALRRALHVTAVSHATARAINAVLPDLKIHVINHGV